jgi:hypothetical protein
LPHATGYEVGFCTRRFARIEFSAAFRLPYLDSELVFVGDEGIMEASTATKRRGFELFTRIKPLDWLWLRGDTTGTTADFRDSGDAVPLAPRFTARGNEPTPVAGIHFTPVASFGVLGGLGFIF